ncbi:MAG: MotA/TolQ/ExbB proton channel family protein [Opitutaceae bacterium]|jgi:biopolymer transport protein ExbB|nr:MotA/TolQ/ExbB proton channel family protein [Opitutaceae bacterium]
MNITSYAFASAFDSAFASNPLLAFISEREPLDWFKSGGPIMWPLIIVSFLAFSVVAERIIFLIREKATRNPRIAGRIYERIEHHDVDGAIKAGEGSRDYIARILVFTLAHRGDSLENAFNEAAETEIGRYQHGLAILDTCITAAPLLGLLGTVTGMIATFGALGGGDIAASAGTITGGVGEALIATTCGLAIAIIGLLPFNILNTRVEQVRREIASTANSLNIVSQKAGGILDVTPASSPSGGI